MVCPLLAGMEAFHNPPELPPKITLIIISPEDSQRKTSQKHQLNDKPMDQRNANIPLQIDTGFSILKDLESHWTLDKTQSFPPFSSPRFHASHQFSMFAEMPTMAVQL